jgi:LytS/YehU family sensor histidine kinase
MKQNEADESEIEALNRDNKIKQQRLHFLVICIIGLLLLGFLYFRNSVLHRRNEGQKHALLKKELQLQRLETEKKHLEFKQIAADLEMQALRAQMNPHFIFNSLNAINCFVLKNDMESASDYLTRFSRLIRSVLQHSLQAAISLSDEIATLRLYIELEQLRFKNHFRFNIYVSDSVDVEGWMIPPLLLQPFVENAIWHGLMHREEEGGELTIDIDTADEELCCSVTDNGVGRKAGGSKNINQAMERKSLGLEMTAARLKLLNPGKATGSYFSIADLKTPDEKPAGTRVTIRIPAEA